MAAVAQRLARLKETPVAPAWVIRGATGKPSPRDAEQESLPAMQALETEAHAVRALAGALNELAPAWPQSHGALLL